MAKVKAPFLSLSASGTIAKTLVASVWKGVKYMRSYVVPANPRTPAQTLQRNNFTALVTEWHNPLRLAVDKIAFNKRASIQRLVMSGFNVFMRIYRSVFVAGDTLTYFYDMAGVYSSITDKVTIDGSCNLNSTDCQVYFYNETGALLGDGTIVSSVAGVFSDEIDFEMDPQPAFFKIIVDAAGHGGESGYYIVTV